MVRTKAKLTALEVKQAKPDPRGKNKVLADGDGLRLLVHPSGAKYWQFRKTQNNKETTLQIGSYPTMDLASARDEAEKLRKQAAAGKNLMVERRLEEQRSRESAETTFKSVATELLELKNANGISPSYYKKIAQAFEANLYPKLGAFPIDKIDAPLFKSILKPIEARESFDMLRFMLQIGGEVFDYAKSNGKFTGDNPAHVLRKNVFPKHKRQKMKALPWEEMVGFLNRLDGFRGEYVTNCCIHLVLWTALRPSEARLGEWSEIDFENASWTIPAIRMKARKEHKVPLPKQAIAMLKELRLFVGDTSKFLFPTQRGAKGGVITDITLLKAVRRAVGHDNVDVHGFRAVFRTHAAETLKWDFDVLEAALAHGKKNPIVEAYDRATHFATRRLLAQWYADELDRVKKGSSTNALVLQPAA